MKFRKLSHRSCAAAFLLDDYIMLGEVTILEMKLISCSTREAAHKGFPVYQKQLQAKFFFLPLLLENKFAVFFF